MPVFLPESNEIFDRNFLVHGPLLRLVELANLAREQGVGKQFDLCTIVNAKSGRCTENCKFCAQSAHHQCDIDEYPLRERKELLAAAREAKKNGAQRFGIVTSGKHLNGQELKEVARTITDIREKVGITPCASLGTLNKEELSILKDAGLARYHHNLETSSRFYPQIVSTHSFEERLTTIAAAKDVGLEVCSGGIIGMGEDWDDRIALAVHLKDLEVDAVPINILVPVKGTALEGIPLIHPMDAIRTICIFRLIIKEKTIKIAAGRETVLKDFQTLGFMAGANGMLIGGYLTTKGQTVAEDQQLVEEVLKTWG